MTNQIPNSIRVLRLVADDWLIREFSLATGGQGYRQGAMHALGVLIQKMIAPMFPLQPDTTAHTVVQWLVPHDASDDSMTLMVEIFGPNPGGDRPCTIIENAISEEILAAVGMSRDRGQWAQMNVVAHIHS